jgi:hypothetical protein
LASVLIATLLLVEKSENCKRYNIRWEMEDFEEDEA